jgi:hypothetical protein
VGAGSSGSCLVSSRGRNAQLKLRTRIELAPHRQLAAHQLGAFAQATHAVVSGAAAFIEPLRVNAIPIIPQPQLPFVMERGPPIWFSSPSSSSFSSTATLG